MLRCCTSRDLHAGQICAMVLAALSLVLVLLPYARGDALLQHSCDESSFHVTGHISLPADSSVDGSYKSTALLEREPLSSDQLDALKQLVQRNGLYRMQVALPGQQPVATSLRAACMAEHMLEEHLKLHLDEDGSIVGLQVSVPGGSGRCSQQQALRRLEEVRGKLLGEAPSADVALEYPRPAPKVPKGAPLDAAGAQKGVPGQGMAQQPQQGAAGQQQAKEGESKEGEHKQPPPDNRSWLQKNFLYVIAGVMLVFNVLSKMNEVQNPQAAAGAARPAGGRPAGR